MSSVLAFIGGMLAGLGITQMILHWTSATVFGFIAIAGVVIICYNFWVVLPKEVP